MDVREKLVEQAISHFWYGISHDIFSEPVTTYAKLAIEALEKEKESGVTVQEEAKLYWKPVKPGEWNLTCSACDSHLGCGEDANFCPECGEKFVYPKAVAPQPPKGE